MVDRIKCVARVACDRDLIKNACRMGVLYVVEDYVMQTLS